MAAMELTLTVTGFKAPCLDLIRKLEHSDLKAHHPDPARKAGRRNIAAARRPKKTFADIYGCMRWKMKIPEGADLTESAVDPEDWDAVRGVLLNE